MNKLFTRIGVAFAGIAMAIGVGVAVGLSPRAAKVEATDPLATYTFTNTANGTAVTNVSTIKGWFTTSGTDIIQSVSDPVKVAPGASGGSGNNAYTLNNAIKIGTKSAAGSLTINMKSGYSIGKVSITGFGWNANLALTVEDQYSTKGQFTVISKANLNSANSVDFTFSSGKTSITISTDAVESIDGSAATASVITSISFYAASADVDATSLDLGSPTFQTGASADNFYEAQYFDISATLSSGSNSKVAWSVVNSSTATATITPAQNTLSARITATSNGSLTINAQAVKPDGQTVIAGISDTYTVTVKANLITGITHTGTPVEQCVGEDFDPTGLTFYYTRELGTDSTAIDISNLTFNGGNKMAENQTSVTVSDASSHSETLTVTTARFFDLNYDNLLSSTRIFAKTDGVQQATYSAYTEIKFVKSTNAAMTIKADGITKIVVDQSNTYSSNMSVYFGAAQEGTALTASSEVTSGKASWIIGHQYEYTFTNGTDFAYFINKTSYDVNYYSMRVYYTNTAVTAAIGIGSGTPKTSYVETDTFDMNGATVAAYRDANRENKLYTLPAASYTFNKSVLATTDTAVTITYGSLTYDVAVTVAAKVNLTSIEINEPESTTMDIDDELQLSVTINEGAPSEVVWSSSDDDIAEVSDSGLVTAHLAGTVTITATGTNGTATTEDDLEDTIELTVNNWVNSDFADGSEYVMASIGSYNYSSTTYYFDVEFTGIESNLGTDADHVAYYACTALITVEYAEAKDRFYLKYSEGYLGYGAKKALNVYENKANAKIWTLTKGSDNVVTIADASTSANKLQYNPNNGSGRFAVYDSSQKAVSLIPATDTVKLQGRAEQFINAYMHPDIPTTDETKGTNCYGTDGTDGYFGVAKAALEKSKEQGGYADCVAQFAASGDMWTRYVTWGAACSVVVSYSGSAISYNAPAVTMFNLSDDNGGVIAIITVIAAVSTLAIGGFFFLRKRKIG